MITILLIAAGGSAGAAFRWLLTLRDGELPWRMMTANVVASGAAGAFADLDGSWRWLVNIGLLGALSTWSSLALATVRLAQADRSMAAATVAVGTTVASIAAAVLTS